MNKTETKHQVKSLYDNSILLIKRSEMLAEEKDFFSISRIRSLCDTNITKMDALMAAIDWQLVGEQQLLNTKCRVKEAKCLYEDALQKLKSGH